MRSVVFDCRAGLAAGASPGADSAAAHTAPGVNFLLFDLSLYFVTSVTWWPRSRSHPARLWGPRAAGRVFREARAGAGLLSEVSLQSRAAWRAPGRGALSGAPGPGGQETPTAGGWRLAERAKCKGTWWKLFPFLENGRGGSSVCLREARWRELPTSVPLVTSDLLPHLHHCHPTCQT